MSRTLGTLGYVYIVKCRVAFIQCVIVMQSAHVHITYIFFFKFKSRISNLNDTDQNSRPVNLGLHLGLKYLLLQVI